MFYWMWGCCRFYRLSGSMKIRFSILPEAGVLQPEMFIEIDMGSWAFFQASPFYAAHGVAVYDSPIWWRNNLLIRILLAVPVSWLFGPHSSTQLLPTLIIVVTSTLTWGEVKQVCEQQLLVFVPLCSLRLNSTLFSKSSPLNGIFAQRLWKAIDLIVKNGFSSSRASSEMPKPTQQSLTILSEQSWHVNLMFCSSLFNFNLRSHLMLLVWEGKTPEMSENVIQFWIDTRATSGRDFLLNYLQASLISYAIFVLFLPRFLRNFLLVRFSSSF